MLLCGCNAVARQRRHCGPFWRDGLAVHRKTFLATSGRPSKDIFYTDSLNDDPAHHNLTDSDVGGDHSFHLKTTITMSSRLVPSTLKRVFTRGESRLYQAAFLSDASPAYARAGKRRALHKSVSPRKASSATGAIPLVGQSSCVQSTPRPTSKQIKTLFVASAVPMMG